jgi:hypothetical protein
MLIPNPDIDPARDGIREAGWPVAGAVVVLMAALVYLTNGRGSHPPSRGHVQHAAVFHSQR